VQKFTDKTGAEWEIELPAGEVFRIAKENAKFDLLEPERDELAKRLDDELPLFWELLWLVVMPQAEHVMPTAAELKRRGNKDAFPGLPGITGEEFGRRMAGDCLMSAKDLFFIEWRDFFHQIQRPEKAAALETIRIIHQRTVAKVMAKLEASNALQTLPERMDAKLDRVLAKPFSDLQDSFDSILNDTPTVSSGSSQKESPATIGQS
jgi:hypothetical protein